MKTICVLNGKIIMSQDGDALVAMKSNASQYPSAVVSVVTNEEYVALVAAQPKAQDEINDEIKAKIVVLDQKRIRPLAEGDTAYLEKLNEQIKALRDRLI